MPRLLGPPATLTSPARETFEHLRATPWLERLDAVAAGEATPA